MLWPAASHNVIRPGIDLTSAVPQGYHKKRGMETHQPKSWWEEM